MLDQLHNAVVARKVAAVALAGVLAEGPVHLERLARVTAGAFGLARVSGARREALAALVPADAVVGDFAWPEQLHPTTWTGFRRTPPGVDRPLEHVAPEEIANALVALCRAGSGMSRDELSGHVLDVFGASRRAPSLLALLAGPIDSLLAAGRLTAQPSGLLVP
jgi:hypothetical protein